jgi:hypothetical protein
MWCFTRTHMSQSREAIVRPPSRSQANTFHENAMLCRAAENTCYFAVQAISVGGIGSCHLAEHHLAARHEKTG